MQSHSSTSAFNNCPYRHHLEKLGYRQQVVGASDNKRVWSIALHAALKCIHLGQSEKAEAEFMRLYPENLDSGDKTRTQVAASITLAAYQLRWANDASEWECLEAEFDNQEDVDEEQSHLVIDLVMRHRASGSIYFWDHKVKTKWDNRGKGYELDAQLSRYAAYVGDKWGDCAGALVNVIVPQYRERKWKDRPAGWDIQFDRKLYSRTSDQIAWWRASQADWEFLIGQCNATKTWPKHAGPLCSWCQYFDGCYAESQGAGPEIWETLYRPQAEAEEFNVQIEDGE